MVPVVPLGAGLARANRSTLRSARRPGCYGGPGRSSLATRGRTNRSDTPLGKRLRYWSFRSLRWCPGSEGGLIPLLMFAPTLLIEAALQNNEVADQSVHSRRNLWSGNVITPARQRHGKALWPCPGILFTT